MLDLRQPLPVRLDTASFKADPHPTLARMREAGAVVPVRMPFLSRVWTTTDHAATLAAVKSDLLVVDGAKAGKRGGTPGLQWWMPRLFRRLANNMLGHDDPEHRRLRKLVDHAFARRGVLDMRSDVERLADRLLDEMTDGGRGEVDLVRDYARRLPLHVIADLLGVPERERDPFARWASQALLIASPLGIFRALGSLRRITRFVGEQIAEARRTSRPGLIGELVRAEEDGDRLNEEELIAMIFLLLLAGFETVTHLVSTAIVTLDEHREQRAWWLADPRERTPRAVEELSRFITPVQFTKPRYVSRDIVFEGQELRRGEVMMPCLAAANADPAMFEGTDELRLDRFPNPHLVYSSGVHFCLGIQLARLEAQVALERLHARFPNLHLTGARHEWVERIGMRGLARLPARPNG